MHEPPSQLSAISPRRVGAGSGENAYKCYQCKRCTIGCPVAGFADLHPAQIMRAVQLGDVDAGRAQPLHLAVHRLRDVHHALPAGHRHRGRHGRAAQDRRGETGPRARRRARSRTSSSSTSTRMKRWGRLYEVELLALDKITRPSSVMDDVPLGIKMFLKGKINPLPTVRRRAPDEAHGRGRRAHRRVAQLKRMPIRGEARRLARPGLLGRQAGGYVDEHASPTTPAARCTAPPRRWTARFRATARSARPRAGRDPGLGVLRQHRRALGQPPAGHRPAGQRAGQGRAAT